MLKVLLSPDCSESTSWLLEKYRSSLRNQDVQGPGCLWIAPSFRAADDVREALIESAHDAFMAPAVMTFARLAEIALGEADIRVRPLDKLEQGHLLRRAITTLLRRGELQYFGAIAESGGFESLLGDLIRELKRHDVSPRQFQQAQQNGFAGSRRRSEELALLYQEYENLLRAGRLVDGEGRLAAATRVLQKRQSRSFAALALVVVDGIVDFSTLQHKILALLSRRAQSMIASLPGDPLSTEATAESAVGNESEERYHLFAGVRRTIAVLRTRHAEVQFCRPAVDKTGHTPLHSDSPWPAQEYLRRNLFRSYRNLPPISDAVRDSLDRIDIVAASSVKNELHEIARRIKMLLVREEAKPAEIVVAFRSVRDVADQIRTVFDDFGIPHVVDAPELIETTALARSLLAVLRLHIEDWPFRRLLAVVTNRAIACFDTMDANQHRSDVAEIDPRANVERCLREAQLPAGCQALLDVVARWADLATEGVELDADSRASHALAPLLSFQAMLAALPEKATFADWIPHLEALLQGLGLLPHGSPATGGTDANDVDRTTNDSAWQKLRRGLQRFARVDRWTLPAEQLYSTAELVQVLTHIAAAETLPAQPDDVGRVRILSASAAREQTPRHLFLAGLSEKAFPEALRPDRLYERHEFQESQRMFDSHDLNKDFVATRGDAAKPADDAHSDEMLLFFELVTSATCHLTLSYPALDSKAQDLPPSPFLTELERCFGDHAIGRTTIPLGHGISTEDSVCGVSQFRQVAVLQAKDRKRKYLAGLCIQTPISSGAAILDAIESISRRCDRENFGPFDGLLTSEAVGVHLAKRFGPDYLWSPSQLERYGSCPFRFFAEQVLALEPLTDIALQSDARRLGNLVHQSLAMMHGELRDVRLALNQADQLDPRLVEGFQQAIDQVVATTPLGGLEQVLRKIDCREIEGWGEQYGKQYAAYHGSCEQMEVPMQPRYFEVRFGPGSRKSTSESDAELSTEEPFALLLDQDESGDTYIRITGQVDRIDLGQIAGQTVFNVIDYKTGKAVKLKTSEVAAGRQLQLPIYAMATEQMLLADIKALAWQAGYWNLRQGGFEVRKRGQSVLSMREHVAEELQLAEQWDQLRTTLLERIRAIVANVRAGNFPVYNEDLHCTGTCPFNTACRIAHIRSLEKRWVVDVPKSDVANRSSCERTSNQP